MHWHSFVVDKIKLLNFTPIVFSRLIIGLQARHLNLPETLVYLWYIDCQPIVNQLLTNFSITFQDHKMLIKLLD